MASTILTCPVAVNMWKLPVFGDGFRVREKEKETNEEKRKRGNKREKGERTERTGEQ